MCLSTYHVSCLPRSVRPWGSNKCCVKFLLQVLCVWQWSATANEGIVKKINAGVIKLFYLEYNSIAMMKSTLPKDKPGKMRIRAFPVSKSFVSVCLYNNSTCFSWFSCTLDETAYVLPRPWFVLIYSLVCFDLFSGAISYVLI